MEGQDFITQHWFDSSRVKVQVEADIADLFDEEALARLSGAFRDSIVRVTREGMAIVMEVEHPAVLKMRRELSFDIEQNCWYVYNSKFRLNTEYWGQQLAVRSIATQARAAQALGIQRLSTHAVGSYQLANRPNKDERWSGYWIWPRIGFDGEIPSNVRSKLSTFFQRCQTVSDLIWTEEGAAEWRLHGEDVALRFDTAEGSRSWKILERYTSKRGIRI